MPSSDAILQGLAVIANDWWWLAVVWHLFFADLLFALSMHRLSHPEFGYLLLLPVLSVSVLALVSGNPFNGAVFAALGALLLAFGARTLPAGPAPGASTTRVIIGLLLVAFGWVYPHFVEVSNPAWYLIAAPLGLLPCPTLSAIIGLTLMSDLHRARAWSVPLVVAGVGYGALGVFYLGVTIDAALLAGAIALATASWSRPVPAACTDKREGLEPTASVSSHRHA